MKVKYLNEKVEYDFDTDLIIINGESGYTLEPKEVEAIDKGLEVLDSAEMALGMLSEFPNFITVAWTPVVAQLKAVGWKIKDKNEGFLVTKSYEVRNGGTIQVDTINKRVRAITKGTSDNHKGNTYYPIEQPVPEMFNRIVKYLDKKADTLYATSFIKNVDINMENHNAKN